MKRTLITTLVLLQLMAQAQDYVCYTHLRPRPTQPVQASTNTHLRTMGTVVSIPVVVHILHLGSPVGTAENISDTQILAAISSLNDAFRKKSGTIFDGSGVDTEIEFCLAQIDPNGKLTKGITRTNASNVADYATNGITISPPFSSQNEEKVKAVIQWPSDKYYNIWVVHKINNSNTNGVQGFGSYPGNSPTVDGVVVLANSFGFDTSASSGQNLKTWQNRNMVLIHETGHYLNLDHPFADFSPNSCLDGDGLSDTPKTNAVSGCPNPGTNGTCNAPYFLNNYMCYTSQLCKNSFTAMQKTRMRTSLGVYRLSLLNTNCNLPNGLEYELSAHTKATAFPNPTEGVIHFSKWMSDIEVTDIYGNTLVHQLSGETLNISALTDGMYIAKTMDTEGNKQTLRILKAKQAILY